MSAGPKNDFKGSRGPSLRQLKQQKKYTKAVVGYNAGNVGTMQPCDVNSTETTAEKRNDCFH